MERTDEGIWRMRYTEHTTPFESDDPDSSRIYWEDPGVHQNLTFPVQPDPWSGMHCWHQKVTHRAARIRATGTATSRSTPASRARCTPSGWRSRRPGPNADGQRRPEFLMRPVKPKRKAFRVPASEIGEQP